MRYIGNFSDLGAVQYRSGKHDVYLCPYCHIVSEKSQDTVGKFYYNYQKGVGDCKRCDSLIFFDGLRAEEYIHQDLLRAQQELAGHNPEQAQYDKQKVMINWATDIKDTPEVYNYLVGTRGIKPSVLSRFDVRACVRPRVGVVFKNRTIQDRMTDIYQVRNLNAAVRHTTLRNMIKPLIWGHLATGDLIVVEGFTSGLAAYQHTAGELHPVVLMGKTISDLQLDHIAAVIKRTKSKVFICSDGGYYESGITIARKIYQRSSSHNGVYLLRMPWGKDPNDVEADQFVQIVHEALLYEPLREGYIRSTVYGSRA